MRLIDADALFKALGFAEPCRECDHALGCFCVDPTWNDVCGAMGDAPTIDAVPVVRCKDCKCWTEWANGTGSCSRFALDWIGTDADDFCSMGERKDDESERD